jgi:carbon storage regulator
MLVLSRKLRESIRINENIIITFLTIQGDKIQLGIDAPRHIPIDREEVYQSKKLIARASQNPGPEKSQKSPKKN